MAAIIFDFDGTLADMKQLIMEVGNEIAARRGWRQVDEALYQELSRGNIRGGLKHLGIPLREVPFALLDGRRKLMERINDIRVFSGIPELIQALAELDHQLFVLSTNSRQLIQLVLEREQLASHLVVLPSSGLFGKAPAVKRFVRTRRLAKQDVWVIGDELRDIEAAKRAGVRSIAVAWGLQHPDTLRAAKPTFVAEKPHQIAEYLSRVT